MKIFAVLFAVAFAAAYVEAGQDGTVSVLKTEQAPAVAAAPAPAVVSTVACCEEARGVEARGVKLSPWHVRRINRIADRQEAREARNCCCKSESCDCCKKSKTLVVEARGRKCDCCR
jgi:hypothetical protein